jgi:hypothetical protein
VSSGMTQVCWSANMAHDRIVHPRRIAAMLATHAHPMAAWNNARTAERLGVDCLVRIGGRP